MELCEFGRPSTIVVQLNFTVVKMIVAREVVPNHRSNEYNSTSIN